MLVPTLTGEIEVPGVDDDDDADEECGVLLATLPMLELVAVEVGTTDNAMTDDPALADTALDITTLGNTELDAEETIVKGVTLVSVTLETELEKLELDILLKGVEETVSDPALELVEVPCDAGRIFVATPIAAVLIVVVKTTMG